ncbi:MAG: flippase [Candidatus Pacebacteria bacterium]|nr:flippase [Candidatus Paceibacterota bacterium]
MKIRNFTEIKSIFFENLGTKQTIFKNTVWLTFGNIASRLLKVILVIYVARILGATEYGKFSFALSFVSLFIVFSNLGLPIIIIREFAKEKGDGNEFYSVLSLKALLSVGALILILIGSFFITPDPKIRQIIFVLALYVLFNSFYSIINCFFNAYQRMEYEAFGVIFDAAVTTAVGLFILFYFPSALNLGYAYLVGSISVLFFSLIIFQWKFFPLKINWEKRVWRKFLSMSWPLALVGLLGSIFNYTDSTMLGYFGQLAATGWYNAAYRIINVSLLPMGLVAGSFFPALSKYANAPKDATTEDLENSKKNLQKVWDYEMMLMILIAIPLVVGGIVFAPKIILFLYGEGFLQSILAFQILIIMAGITFLYIPFYDLLIASGEQKRIFWGTLAAAFFNVITNLIFIPKFSLYGAAATSVVSYFLMFILFFRFAHKYTSINPFKIKFIIYLAGAFLSSVVMYFAISRPQIYNLHIAFPGNIIPSVLDIIFPILTGVIVYGVSLFILKIFAGKINKNLV